MTSVQAIRIWMGFGFVVLLVAFLAVAFFVPPQRLSVGQRGILRFVCALCAGFAGALFVGEMQFQLNAQYGAAGTVAISGGAGFGLFLAVWFTFDHTRQLAPGFHYRVPAGWTFRQAVEAIVLAEEHAKAEFEGFLDTEMSAPLQKAEVRRDTLLQGLLALRLLAQDTSIREYDVSDENPVYRFRIKDKSSAPARSQGSRQT